MTAQAVAESEQTRPRGRFLKWIKRLGSNKSSPAGSSLSTASSSPASDALPTGGPPPDGKSLPKGNSPPTSSLTPAGGPTLGDSPPPTAAVSVVTLTNKTGLFTLCSGGENPDADIIFIHGLMGDAFATWQKGNVTWPQGLLGAKFPNARIVTYGYDADVVRLFSRTSKSPIFDQSSEFIKAVHQLRGQTEKDRPIIFVAHSFGGILLKDGLIWANEQKDISPVHDVFKATKGIVFLGTPHRGASGGYTNFGIVLQRMATIFLQESNIPPISSLKDESDVLNVFSESFSQILDETPISVHSFVEELPMANVKGVAFIVDKSSGYISSAREKKDTLRADHLGMSKFSSNQDQGYLKVEAAIAHCYSYALQPVSKDPGQDIPISNLVAEFAMFARLFDNDLEHLRSSRLLQTCQWICEEPQFQQWLTGKAPFLFLIGPAGSGKSHLASKIVDVLIDTFGKPRRGDNSTPLSVFFFCHAPDNTQRSLLNGLLAMIGQLLLQDEEYAEEVFKIVKHEQQKNAEFVPTIPWLWDKFLTSPTSLQKRSGLFMIVDGLDECEAVERKMFLRSAYHHCSKSAGQFKILCIGRPEVKRDMTEITHEEELPLKIQTIEISGQTELDIKQFIEARMSRMKFYEDSILRSKVYDSLIKNANGMFLWTDLILKEFSGVQTAAEVDSTLERMKNTGSLNQLYEKVLWSLSRNRSELQIQVVNEILTWITFGLEEFSYTQLKEAVEKNLNARIFTLTEEIERCGSLLETSGFQRSRLASPGPTLAQSSDPTEESTSDSSSESDDNIPEYGIGLSGDEIVRIRHATLLDYFHQQDQNTPIKVDTLQAHGKLAITCLDTIIDRAKDQSSVTQLCQYACRNWHDHISRATWDPAFITSVTFRLKELFCNWDLVRFWLSEAGLKGSPSVHRFLHLELPVILKKFLASGSDETDARKWAYSLQASVLGVAHALWASVVNVAEEAGFFSKLPSVGDEKSVLEYTKILKALIQLLNAVERRDDPDIWWYVPSYTGDSQKFWTMDLWAKYPATKSFAFAELLVNSRPRIAIDHYLSAYNTRADEPVISYQLATTYLILGDLYEALEMATNCIEQCQAQENMQGVASALYLIGLLNKGLRKPAQMLGFWKEAAALGSTDALDAIGEIYASSSDLRSWITLLVSFADSENMTLEQTCADAILRQPIFSTWHATFSLVVDKLGHVDLLVKSYKRAIDMTKGSTSDALLNCGCQFRLAYAYAYSLNRKRKAVALWNSTISKLARLPDTSSFENRLRVLSLDELCYWDKITIDHPLVYLSESINATIFEYSRMLISLGKAMERQSGQREEAQTLYRKVMKRAILSTRHSGVVSGAITALANALTALDLRQDAERALGWACTITSPTARDSEDFSSSISWEVLCDNCMAKSNYTAPADIQGYRYKCLVCAEVDLCEPCTRSMKESGGFSTAMRHCNAQHEFLKLPGASWSSAEAHEIQNGILPSSVGEWLDGLLLK